VLGQAEGLQSGQQPELVVAAGGVTGLTEQVRDHPTQRLERLAPHGVGSGRDPAQVGCSLPNLGDQRALPDPRRAGDQSQPGSVPHELFQCSQLRLPADVARLVGHRVTVLRDGGDGDRPREAFESALAFELQDIRGARQIGEGAGHQDLPGFSG